MTNKQRELNEKVESISTVADHYLVKAKHIGHNYFNEFLEAAKILDPLLSIEEYRLWYIEKMSLREQAFSEKQFIQCAVETSVIRFYGEKFPTAFKTEVKINPDNEKDVDCQFIDNGYTYNIEVKCSDFVSKEIIDTKDAFKFGTVGRLPDRGQEAFQVISSAIDEGLKLKQQPPKPHVWNKNMDNNLMEFLQLAHKKFNSKLDENVVNVLVVGCDDANDMQNWLNYLLAPQGLFTEESFSDKATYMNVDIVVFTNLYFKHNKYFDKRVRNCWSLEKSFNLISSNPFRRLPKEMAMKHFITITPNYSEQLNDFVAPGDAPKDITSFLKVAWFIKENLEKTLGQYLFEEKT